MEKMFYGVPLVSIGMPVRNGGALFRRALESVVSQDYPNLEIIISDNASTDETVEVIQEFQSRDDRIVCVRQPQMLGIFANFNVVKELARGEYFMWAAHDDTRSLNFVSTLLHAFKSDEVVLAFSNLYVQNGTGDEPTHREYAFETRGEGALVRMRKQALMQCFHCYGLWRTDVLKSIDWEFAPWWTDMPLMVAAAGKGVFRYVEGATFTYYEVIKSVEQRAVEHEKLASSPRAINVLRLLRATWLTSWRSLPFHLAVAAFAFVLFRQLRDTFTWCAKRLVHLTRRA